MTVYETFALNEYLSSYPNDKSFDQILELIERDDNDVLVWEVYQNSDRYSIVTLIMDLHFNLEQTFIVRENALNSNAI